MKELALASGAVFGGLAVIFGAFGAHALKKVFTPELQKSFETGVKYQMYHAIVLLLLGFHLNFETPLERAAAWCFIVGIFLFSFSIYGLCLSSIKRKKWKFLGHITPLGGLSLLSGWVLLIIYFLNIKTL